jgi:hypothetical protein
VGVGSSQLIEESFSTDLKFLPPSPWALDVRRARARACVNRAIARLKVSDGDRITSKLAQSHVSESRCAGLWGYLWLDLVRFGGSCGSASTT